MLQKTRLGEEICGKQRVRLQSHDFEIEIRMSQLWDYCVFFSFHPHLRTYLLILEREEGRDKEREGEKHGSERETLIG